MARLGVQVRRFRLIIILLVLIIGGLIFFILAGSNQPEPLPAEVIQTITKTDVIKSVSLAGNIEPIRRQDLTLPSGVKITEIKIKEGDNVSEDQLLAHYETSTGFGTKRNDLKAPFAGKVTTLNLVENTIFTGQTPALTLVDGSGVKIVSIVNENDITDLREGQVANFTIPAVSSKEVNTAGVASISVLPVSEGGTGNYEVTLSPGKLPADFRLGMSVEFEIKVAEALDVVAIPESFIIERDGKFFAKKITFKDAQKLTYDITQDEITLGLRTDEMAEVTSGIKEGDQIVAPSFTPNRLLSLLGN